jgi:hypothetical protein
VTGWGAEQLTREELLNLSTKLSGAWDECVRQANRTAGAGQIRQTFAVAAEMCQLRGEVADEIIARAAERAAQASGAAAGREPEAGS